MRWNFRIAKFGYTYFSMFAKTQTLEGVSSLLKSGKHIVMFDLEDCSLKQAEETLSYVQEKYDLSDIFILSDVDRSYRAWCFNFVELKTFLKILLDVEYLDYNFFYYTVKRRKATLRVNSKKNRPPQKIVSILRSYPTLIPDEIEKVVYDTGIEKRGRSILLGEK